jgi:hypothetical protein
LSRIVSALRDGAFLTEERLRLWAGALLIGFAATLIFLIATAHGGVDYDGRPLGSDFSSFYAAGRLALLRHSPYDQEALHHVQQALFGARTPYYSFAYPPIFLLLAVPLAKLPYIAALAFWQAMTLALYLWALARLWRRHAARRASWICIALALAFTATFVNLTHGQNGFLSAALFALALPLLEDNAIVAGICLGLLAFKPQLGLAVPFALAAGGRWRSFAAATATVIALAGAATLAFGIETWRGFLAASAFSQTAILDHGAVGYEKMISLFAAMRLWNAPLAVAYGAQALAALAAIATTAWLWRSPADPRTKGAMLCLATLLVTPFAFDYDLMILAPALALLAADGFANGFPPFRRALLAALWLMPIAARGIAQFSHVPVAVMLLFATFVMVSRDEMRRAQLRALAPSLAAS